MADHPIPEQVAEGLQNVRNRIEGRTYFVGRRRRDDEILVAEVDRLRAANAELVAGLRGCGELFSEIRGDWTDPRGECRIGHDLISALIAKHGTG